MDYSAHSSNSQSYHKQLLHLMKPILPFLRLSEVARLLFLSRRMVDAAFEVAYILMYMIKNYYLNKVDIDLDTEKFFKVVLTKRLQSKIDGSMGQLSETESSIIMKAMDKIDASNLVPFPENLEKMLNGWRITKNGGNG